jgi:hypothetical protein
MTTDQERAIDNAITGGRMIEAIRLYRMATGTSLVPARDYVEARRHTLMPGAPPFPLLHRPGGLLWLPFLFLTLIVAALAAFLVYIH